MPRQARIYISLVLALGLFAFLAVWLAWPSELSWQRLAIYTAATALASLVKFRLPGMTGTYSLNSIFLLAGVVYFSLPEAVIAAAVAVLVQSYVNARRRPGVIQVLFNVANESTSVALGYLFIHALVARGMLPFRPALLASAAAIYFVLNTAFVSGILSILERKPLSEVNQQWYYWSFPYYLLGAAIVGVLPLGGAPVDPQAWVVLLPLAYLVHFFYGLTQRESAPASSTPQPTAAISRSVKLYVAIMVGLAGICLGGALPFWAPDNAGRFVAFLALGLITAAWKVRLPGTTGTASVHFVVLLVSIAQLSFVEVLLVAATGPIVQSFWKPKVKPLSIQVAFNIAAIVVSAAATFAVVRVLLGSLLEASALAFLAIAAVVQFLGNTMAVSGVLCLVEGKPLFQLWQRVYFWSLPYYLVGAAAASLMIATNRSAGWGASLLVLPLMAMVYFSYKLHLEGRAVLAAQR